MILFVESGQKELSKCTNIQNIRVNAISIGQKRNRTDPERYKNIIEISIIVKQLNIKNELIKPPLSRTRILQDDRRVLIPFRKQYAFAV